MNPIMILLVLLGAVAIWFLFSFLYKPIGKFVTRVYKDAVDEINENEKEDNMEEK